MQITPGRRLHADRRRVQPRRATAATRTIRSWSPRRAGPASTTCTPRANPAPSSRRPGSSHRPTPSAPIAVLHLDQHLERLQQLRRPQQLHQLDGPARRADRQRAAGPGRYTRTPIGEWWRRRRVPTALVRAARAVQRRSPEGEQARRSHARSPGIAPRAGRVAAARLAGARGLRLRHLLATPAARRRRSISTPTGCWSSAPTPSTGRAMYERIARLGRAARGGRFMYLGGNGLNCEVEYCRRRTAMRTQTHLTPWMELWACATRPIRTPGSTAASTARWQSEASLPALPPLSRDHDGSPVPRPRRRSLGVRRNRASRRRLFGRR